MSPCRLLDGAFEEDQPVEIALQIRERLGPEVERQGVLEITPQDVLQVRVGMRGQDGERVLGAAEDALGDGAFDVAEELRIAPQPAHGEAAEEDAEEEAPAQVVPLVAIE